MLKRLSDAIALLAAQIAELIQQRKTEFDWLKSHAGLATKQDLKEMEIRLMEGSKLTAQELSEALDKMTTQIGKVATEQATRFDTAMLRIKELEEAIEKGNVSQEISDKFTAAQDALNLLDAAIPDAPVEPPAQPS